MSVKYPYEEAAGILKVVSHPVRLSIVELLENSEMNVKEIQRAVKLKQSITSQHLSAMSGKGILKRNKKGNEVFYSIKKKEVLKLLSCIKGCCNHKG